MVGIPIFLQSVFSGKNIKFRHFEGISPFKMHKIIFFPENLHLFWGSPVNLGRLGLPKTQVFF